MAYYCVVFYFLAAAIALAQSPPPSVIGQRNPNAIKSSAPELRNPGVPVTSVQTKVTDKIKPTESSPVSSTAATDYTPLGETGGGVTLEGAWNTLMQKAQEAKQPNPAPTNQPDPFDLFGGPPNNPLDLSGSMGLPSGGRGPGGGREPGGGRGPNGGRGPRQGSGGLMGGGLPLAALAMSGGGLGEGLGGGLGGMGLMGMLGGGGRGMGGGGGLFGDMGRRGRGGGGPFGGSAPGGGPLGGGPLGGSGPGGGGMDFMRTYLLMQALGVVDTPDPPARTPGRPGAPRPRSPLEELMRMERIRMLRSQQMDRAMRNRNAPQNRGSRFDFQGRPDFGNRPSRNRRPGQGRGRRGIRPTNSTPHSDMPPGEGRDLRGQNSFQQGRGEFSQQRPSRLPPSEFPQQRTGSLPSSDQAMRDSLVQMLEQISGRPMSSNLNRPSEINPQRGRSAGRLGPNSMPRNIPMSDSQFQRSMRVGSRPSPASSGSGLSLADRRADQADLMADRMDNLQAMSPLQRLLMGGGMGMGSLMGGMNPGMGMGPGLLGGLGGGLGMAALLG